MDEPNLSTEPEFEDAQESDAAEAQESDVQETPESEPEEAPVTLRDVLDAQPEPVPLPAVPKQKSRTRDLLVGLLLTALAAVGLWTLVQKGIAFVREKTEETVPAQVQECLLPLAVMDCPSFDDPAELTDEQFLLAGAWAVIAGGKLPSGGTRDLCTVSASELTAAGNALFGTSRRPVCKTLVCSDTVRFYYDSVQDSFLLPSQPNVRNYLPEITSFSESGGVLTVQADYIPDLPGWSKQPADTEKTVTAVLKQKDGAWQICSFSDPEQPVTEPPVTTTAPETTTTTAAATTTTTAEETTTTTTVTTLMQFYFP